MTVYLIKRFLFLIILFMSFELFAQVEHQVSKEEYENAKTSIVVLKNESSKIPLKGQDALVVEYCHFGSQSNNKWQEYMERYFPVKKWTPQFGDPLKYKDDQSTIKILLIELSNGTEEEIDALMELFDQNVYYNFYLEIILQPESLSLKKEKSQQMFRILKLFID